MRVRILSIHPFDAYYSERDELIGAEGMAYGIAMSGHELYQFDFKPAHLRTMITLMYANFEVIR